jgi:hypothetical protein
MPSTIIGSDHDESLFAVCDKARQFLIRHQGAGSSPMSVIALGAYGSEIR